MKKLLEAINKAVHKAGGALNPLDADHYRQRYRTVLKQAQSECPPPNETRRTGQRGWIKCSKAWNLLERLLNYEQDVLRFIYGASRGSLHP